MFDDEQNYPCPEALIGARLGVKRAGEKQKDEKQEGRHTRTNTYFRREERTVCSGVDFQPVFTMIPIS